MPLIEILCDGGPRWGFGHLARSATLAHSIKHRGFSVRVKALSKEGESLLPSCPQDEGDTTFTILDLPYNGDQYVIAAKKEANKVLALDYVGESSPDMVISIFDRETAPNAHAKISGFEYAIIRPEIMNLSPGQIGDKVIVAIGGGDQKKEGELIAQMLSSQGLDVTLVKGPLTDPLETCFSSFTVLRMPSNLPKLLADANWVVTNGGTMMMECMCLGKAIFVAPQTVHEHNLAQIAMKRGALLGIGTENIYQVDALIKKKVGVAARKLVDGNGIHRIIEELGNLL